MPQFRQPHFKKIDVIVAHRTDAELKNESIMEVADLTSAQRLTSALIHLGIWWTVGIVSVIIPVLHFFLVPLGILGGIWIFFRKLNQKEMRKDAVVKCPKCQSEVSIHKGSFNWPLADTCGNCRSGLVLSRR